jgi:hypothetical protein
LGHVHHRRWAAPVVKASSKAYAFEIVGGLRVGWNMGAKSES